MKYGKTADPAENTLLFSDKDFAPAIFLNRIPLTLRMILLTVFVGTIIFILLDNIQTKNLKQFFQAQLLERLQEQSLNDRLHLDSFVKAHHQAARLFVSQKSFADHIQKVAWQENTTSQIIHHRGKPAWLPSQSVMRLFPQMRIVLLLDSHDKVREVYINQMATTIPQSLLEPENHLLQRSTGQNLLTYIGKRPFLLTSEPYNSEDGILLARLLVACPIDDVFLHEMSGPRVNKPLVALFTGERPTVLGSTDPKKLPVGTLLQDIKNDYLIMGKEFFDYGSSELEITFASLIPQHTVEILTNSSLSKAREQRLLMALAIILSSILVIYGISRKIRLFTQYILQFQKQELHTEEPSLPKGDELFALWESFKKLASEVVSYHRFIEAQAKEETRTIVLNAPDAVIATNVSGEITTWNPVAENVFGWTEKEVLGQKIFPTIFPAAQQEHYEAQFNKFLAPDQIANKRLEGSAVHRDGHGFPIELTLSAAKLKDATKFIIFIQDISERKRAEDALRKSEELYRSLVDNIDLGITLIDHNNTILMTNTAQGRMFNKSHLDFEGKMCFQEFEHRSEPCPHCLGPLAMNTGMSQEFEAEGVRDDGSTFNVRIRAFPVVEKPGEKASRFIEVVEDITTKKNTEKELTAERDKAHSLLEKLHHSSAIMEKIFSTTEFSLAYLDKEFNFIQVNRAYAETGHQKPEFFIGKNHFDLYPHDENMAIFQSVVDSGIAFSTMAKPFTYPDHPERGTSFWDWTLQPVIGNDGKVDGLMLSLSDVTERKLSEEKLLQAQKLESIGTLAGGIAHDFNNLLTSILGFTSLVMLDSPKDSTNYSNLEQVIQAGHRATDLVRQILSFSRHNDQERKPLQLQAIVKETLKLLRGTLPTTIEINQSIGNQYPPILANPTQIHQVVMNLCTNAYHAMREEGGKLEVKLEEFEVDSSHACQVQNLLVGKYLRLSVSDTGHGIDESILDRIFEPYFTTKKEGEGTGLGLSTTYGIIVSLGGGISVDSQIGRGTTFYLYFPVTESEYLDPKDLVKEKPLPSLNLRILFVDDLRTNVLLGERILTRTGCEVIGQTDSLEALQVFRINHNKFDLVITDQTMPNLTGFELAKHILAIRPDIPIIMLTGHSDMVDEKKAKAIGIKEFLMKPLDVEMLIGAISKVIS